MAFKMKGWSGSQKTSPIRQPKNLQQGLENIQKFISNTVEGIKPQSESSGFGLTDLEKAQAKKLGISEYQYKTGAGISSSTRHKKRTFEKKHGLGKYADKTTAIKGDLGADELYKSSKLSSKFDPLAEEKIKYGDPKRYSDLTLDLESEAKESTPPPTEVDYGEGSTKRDWSEESSTGWNLHDLVAERKNFDAGSAEYKKVHAAINAAYKEGPPVEKEPKKEPKPQPKQKKSSIYTSGYIRDYTGEDIRGKKYN